MDAPRGPDANLDTGVDAFAAPDVFVPPDAFVVPDAYVIPDAFVVPDAYVIPDAFVVPDAYVIPDAFVVPDAFAPRDAFTVPVCGNRIVERGEQCDDGNAIPGDGCDACRLPVTGFRFTNFLLRDPHVFTSIPVFGCRDMTDAPILGYSVNGDASANFNADRNDDGLFDLSIATVFRPLRQADGATSALEVQFPTCTVPVAPARSVCTASAVRTVTMSLSRTSGACLDVVPGSVVHNYSPLIALPNAPCYASPVVPTFNIALTGLTLPLRDVRIAATFVGDPAVATINGVLYGFLTEAFAMTATVPDATPGIGGQPLANLFPGGSGCCAGHDDVDIYEGARGWWIYINFTTTGVTWND
jgi:cysteine-rich repeat protein